MRARLLLLLALLADLGPVAALAAYTLWCQQQPLFKEYRRERPE